MAYGRKTVLAVFLLLAITCLTGGSAVGIVLGQSVVSGTVTSAADGTPISGATVRILGEGSPATTTDSTGSYTLQVEAGPNTRYNLLAAAAGRSPMRRAVGMTSGGSAVCDFALKSPAAGLLVSLPAPLDWGEPPSAPAAPGESFPVSFADMSALPSLGAPAIAGWNETVKPDESFTLTGAHFTARTGSDAGTDTTLWVWARTSENAGVLRQAKIWKSTGETILATMPDDIPFGVYLVWVENSAGASSPVLINRIRTTHVGPVGNVTYPGATIRVMGKNISMNRGTAATDSFVYVQSASGGVFQACSVTRVDPYMVEFALPAGLSFGNYKIFVHNGQAGAYGWSDPLDIIVQAQWVRGSAQSNLTPSGGDDTTAIQNAVNAMGSSPNGGTVSLSAGTFIVTGHIALRDSVEIKGAGMDTTFINLQMAAAGVSPIELMGAHCGLSDLTIREMPGYAQIGWNGTISHNWTPCATYTTIKRVKFTGTPDAPGLSGPIWLAKLGEMSECVLYALSGSQGACWYHNNTSYGPRYGYEAPFYMGYKRDVFEYNHIETQNWPYDPTKPNPYNYMDNLPQSEWSKMCWAWRIALTYCNELYGAHNTSKDVAVQDNKGEVFLFHPYPGAWFGNVVSASGLTTTLRTDGIVEGQSMTLMNYETPPEMPGGTPVPDGGWWGSIDSQVDTGELIVDSLVRIVIVSGKGMGQYRRIIGHTTSTVTLDRPWLVQPDSSSVAMIARLYADNVLYKNEINAFPPGYKRSTDASMGVGAGDAWALSLEGNVSRRTSTGIGISPSQVTPVCWNEMRDEKAYDCAKSGFDMFTLMVPRSQPGPGPLTSIGNVFRGGEINVVGGTTANGAITGVYIDNGIGTTIENVSIYGKRAVELGGINGPAPMGTILSTSPYGSMMLRKCSVTADSNPVLSPGTPQPMYIDYFNDGQFLSRNTYAGSTQAYWGVGGYQLPVALTKCARFDGYIGGHFDPVVVPIVNAGMQTYSWTASPSDSWITATIGASPTVFGESDSGRLVISVNTTGMSAGEHWGYVTVTAGAKTIKVGVCVDLAAAAPAQLSPIASFTATPPGGIAPVTSEFDAGASSDPDGAIVSYSWDFGDGTAASGVTASHTYSTPGIYLVTLTVIDNSGRTGTAVASITATAPLTAVNVSGNPNPPASAGAVVALTASAVGGYNVNYKFLQRSGNAWSTLRDYGTAPSINWTVPSTPGYYAIRVLARNATSTNAYDVMGEIAYPVGLVPTDGMRLWLRGDSGIGFDDQGKVASWADQSGAGNNVSQSTDSKKPSLVTAAFDGKPAVRFAGPDQMLQSSGLVLTGNTSFTTFTVASPTSVVPNVYQFLWWNGAASSTAGYGCYIHSTDLKLKCAWGPDTYWMTDSTSALAGKWYKMSTRYTPGNYQGWLNGLFLTTKTYALSNFNGGGFFSVGNMGPSPAQGFYGDIGEILIYNRALTDTERANVESYILSKWSSVPAVAKDRLSDVKALSDQMVVSITGAKVVTAATGIFAGGVSYIEEPDRTCGLKLTGAAVSAWENVTLTGTMGTDSCGERVLQVSSVDSRASGTELGTLGMMNKTLTASGQLVRVWGRVTEAGEGYFVLNDGSGSPVRIDTGGLVSPITVNIQSGQYAAATGLAGKGAGGVTVVRPRSDSDVRVY